jgi:Vitamin K-dependent gamma-carboxylase
MKEAAKGASDQRIDQQMAKLLFPAQSDAWLSVLRVGLALQVIVYLWSLKYDWNYLLAGTEHTLTTRKLAEAIVKLQSPFIPRLGWLIDAGNWLGVGESTILSLTRDCLAVAASFLLLGLFCRVSAIGVWFLHLCAVKSTDLFSYGVDNFTSIGLFYLALSPLPDRFTLDRALRDRSHAKPELLGFFRRVLQLHMCIVYFFGGLNKSLGTGWWTGDNIWRALIRPPFNVIPPETLVHWKVVFPLLGIFVCLTETAYPLLIWVRRTRALWLTSICSIHIGIGAAMGMYQFALVMIVLNLAAFGPATWGWLRKA